MKQMLAMCSFGLVDQQRFARLSGDANPSHLDAEWSRRGPFGEPVVHGIHLLLRSLDAWIGEHPPAVPRAISLRRLRARFPNPALLECPIAIELCSEAAGSVKLKASSEGETVLHLDLQWDYAVERSPRPPAPPSRDALPRSPRDLSLDDIEDTEGTLPLFCDPRAVATEFPELFRYLGPRQIADLLAFQRLTGMQCPGLYSILAELDLEGRKPELPRDALEYRVVRLARRYSLVRLQVAGAGFSGRIDTFRSRQATPPMSFQQVRPFVAQGEFADQVALVCGGSRGLGAMATKLIAAGGGWPIATWHRGERDALALAREIRSRGARCDVLHCDVGQPGRAFNWLDAQGIVPTHLYYMASPRVLASRSGSYSRDLYHRFATTCVDGFAAMLLACQHRWPQGIHAFYPSTLAVEQPAPGLAEFADAKRAGEALCRDFDSADIPIRIRVARLPRVDTDRSASLVRAPAANPLDVMLHELRRVKELHR